LFLKAWGQAFNINIPEMYKSIAWRGRLGLNMLALSIMPPPGDARRSIFKNDKDSGS
jgi:hypothetical protein